MSAALLVFALLVATVAVSSGSRDRSGARVSPTVVCLTRGRSYGSHRRLLNRAFLPPITVLNRNSSFAFRPALKLTHHVVELSEFSPPEVCPLALTATVGLFRSE